MLLVRCLMSGSDQPTVAVLDDGVEGAVVRPVEAPSIAHLVSGGVEALREALTAASGPGVPLAQVRLLPPVDGAMEVWAAGVTYRSSQLARMEESERSATVYEQVYDAERPELFFKAPAWRVCGDGEPVAIRADSSVDVPEPELALVVDPGGEVVGFTVCNDMSSRTIEGENPLYLPQAKIYLGSTAVGPGIRPVWEVTDPYDLSIDLRIERAGQTAWSGTASTSELHRRFDDLVEHLMRADAFPHGAVLSTGTSLVPDLPFTLQAGDVIRIELGGIGVLTNPVVEGLDDMRWLTPDPIRAPNP